VVWIIIAFVTSDFRAALACLEQAHRRLENVKPPAALAAVEADLRVSRGQ
jgi:hypothetical protein